MRGWGIQTSSSAVAESPRDALCPSVVSFKSIIPRAQCFIIVRLQSSDLPLHRPTIKCCSVTFGATLLLVIHFRRRLPPSTNSAAYQRLVSSIRHGRSQLNVLHLLLQPFTARDGVTHWLRIAISACQLHLDSTPPLRRFRQNIAMTFGMEQKLKWCGYPMEKKISKICLFVLTEFTNVTDRQTDTAWTA